MKPAPFEYHAPDSLDEALDLLRRHGDEARPLAGGQSLIPAMNFRLAQPAILVDLERIPGLAHITPAEGGLRIGAMTRQRAVEINPLVPKVSPLLEETLPHIAHPQIRNRGTFGGSIAHADPAAELPAILLALDARVHLRSASGERSLPATEFYTGLFETALQEGELLVDVEIPPPPERTGWAFLEMARRHGDYALVGVAVRLGLDSQGRCQEARVAFLSVGEGPVLAHSAAEGLLGQPMDVASAPQIFADAAHTAGQEDIDPPGDLHATPAYRRHLAEVLSRRALETARERALASL